MKKILFGIMLIFLSLSLILLGEFRNVLIVDEDFDTMLCVMLPLLGLVISIWGLFEKDK